MSERTESVPATQSQTPNTESAVPTTAAPAATPAAESAVPSPEVTAATPAVQESAEQAAEAAAEREAELREQAVETLTACRKAFAKGEAAYRAGLLEAGRLADQFVHQKLALGDKRAAATDLLTLELSKYASSTVDPNALIACYWSYHLLAESQDLAGKGKKQGPADVVPLGVWKEHWARLAERQAKDTPQEHWTLLPGLETECKAAFAKAIQDGLSRDAVRDLVRGLVVEYARRQADAKAAEGKLAAERATAEKARLEEQAAKVRAAREEHEKAQQAAKAEANEQTTQAVAESAARLQAEQKAVVEAQARVEQAEREKALADKRAKAEAERLERESRKAEAKATKGQTADKPASKAADGTSDPKANPADQRGTVVGGNLLRTAAAGTVKDIAEMACELVTGGDAPDDVFAELLRALKASGEMSKATVRAIDAALVVLTRKESPKPPAGPSPVEVANRIAGTPAPAEQRNGQPAAA
jgi:hypothetical protein